MSLLMLLPLLFAAGVATGVLNVLAGGGSFLTLPLLIFCGLPATVANGTNRIGTWLQCVPAIARFDRAGVLDRRLAVRATIPALLGAGIGTWIALRIGDRDFERLLAVLMVAITAISLWSPRPGRQLDTRRGQALLALGFFLVGVYGGFVQAGVGFLILAVTTFAGLDLVRGNAIKVVTVLGFTTLSLALFAASGKVDWGLGLALGAGNAVGGWLGARVALARGDRWLRVLVTVAILGFAVKLWFR